MPAGEARSKQEVPGRLWQQGDRGATYLKVKGTMQHDGGEDEFNFEGVSELV